jgi:hypothetical protein
MEPMEPLYPKWEPRWAPSWLCLKDVGGGKVQVVQERPGKSLDGRPGWYRLHECWLGGLKVYDPATEFKIGLTYRVPQ